MSLLRQPGWLRGLEVGTGILAMALSLLVFAYPGLGVASLVVLLSVALIFVGIRSLTIAGLGRLPSRLRVLSAISGIASLIFAFVVVLLPGYGLLSLIFMLSFGLVLYGASRIALAYALKALPTSMRGMIAAIGVLDIIVSAIVLVFPGLPADPGRIARPSLHRGRDAGLRGGGTHVAGRGRAGSEGGREGSLNLPSPD